MVEALFVVHYVYDERSYPQRRGDEAGEHSGTSVKASEAYMSTSERGTRSGKAVSRPLRRLRTKRESQGSSEDGTDEKVSAPPVASRNPLPAAGGTEQAPLVNLTGYLGN